MMPREFRGDHLMPLNALREYSHDIYETACKKYEGRENLRKVGVAPLNCEWSDLIMFTFCHPQVIVSEYRAAGKIWEEPRPWLSIELSELEPANAIILNYTRDFSEDLMLGNSDFSPYRPENVSAMSGFRAETRDYYRTADDPLLFFRLPHLLYKGVLPRKLLSVVHVQ